MHAVILTHDSHKFGSFEIPKDSFNFVLCHVRRVNNHREELGAPIQTLRTRRSYTEDFSTCMRKLSDMECEKKVSLLCSELKEDF